MSVTVGIPRALLYHEFGGLWQDFFANLGIPVSVSGETTKQVLDRGTSLAVDESCLPLKLYLGHAEALLGQVSHLFVPRVVRYHRDHYLCAKFAGLPDIVRNTFGLDAGRIIAPNIDGPRALSRLSASRAAAAAVGRSPLAGLVSFRRALASWRGRMPAASDTSAPKAAVIGHSYILNDPFLAGDIFAVLAARGVAAATPEELSGKVLYAETRRFAPEIYWQLSAKLAGAARHFAGRPDIAGLILVSSFGCGFDSLMNEYIEHHVLKSCGKPYLVMNLDEHTGRAGAVTRIEAFWDLVEWRLRR